MGDIFFKIVFLVVFIIFLIYYAHLYRNNTINKIDDNRISIIISRYNENLKWTLEYPYNKYKYIVYNKGNNDFFEKKNVINVINLPNVGRESHTYLYHIITNYDNLKDINVFLPGSIDTNHTIFKKR